MEAISLHGKVILITGGSRGMGREMALAYAKAGAAGITITAAAAKDETRDAISRDLEIVAAEIDAVAGKPIALELHSDVTVWADCEAAVKRTVERFGALHVLVNNAGKSQRYHGDRNLPFWETDPEGWRVVIDTNVVGPYRMARAAVPEMLKAGWGRVINISKSQETMHEAFSGAYGPSKACLEAESISWAEELSATKVTVNSIEPGGAVDTLFGRGEIRGVGLPPTVVIPVALWLASEQSAEFNGCRFDAKLWDEKLPNRAAAEGCQERSLFAAPRKRKTKLDKAWKTVAAH
jgi:NAD(P)-dependent dehydrogenase (short-subunit alcohol dehydrogenase family)